MKQRFVVCIAVLSLAACGRSNARYVARTRVPFPATDDAVLRACEEYRLAVERGDADALMLMAHRQYWEDSGTPSGSDDYGYDRLRNILLTRLRKASDIGFVGVTQQCKGELFVGCRAAVDTVTNAYGTARPAKLVLEWDGRRWLFISGM